MVLGVLLQTSFSNVSQYPVLEIHKALLIEFLVLSQICPSPFCPPHNQIILIHLFFYDGQTLANPRKWERRSHERRRQTGIMAWSWRNWLYLRRRNEHEIRTFCWANCISTTWKCFHFRKFQQWRLKSRLIYESSGQTWFSIRINTLYNFYSSQICLSIKQLRRAIKELESAKLFRNQYGKPYFNVVSILLAYNRAILPHLIFPDTRNILVGDLGLQFVLKLGNWIKVVWFAS